MDTVEGELEQRRDKWTCQGEMEQWTEKWHSGGRDGTVEGDTECSRLPHVQPDIKYGYYTKTTKHITTTVRTNGA